MATCSKIVSAVVLNDGPAAWAFEDHAFKIAVALWLDVATIPGIRNYVLGWGSTEPPKGTSFVPWDGIQIAGDKRLQAAVFAKLSIPIPKTHLADSEREVVAIIRGDPAKKWALKYPISCAATGHRLLDLDSVIPRDWPRPFVIQEFIPMAEPEVYRLYCVAGNCFGWNVRRFPKGAKPSPWVAHACGARYVHLKDPPALAVETATRALQACGLFESFGVVDLLKSEAGWLVLEVGTDGPNNYVDRDFDNAELTDELDERLAQAFWKNLPKPWGNGPWCRRACRLGNTLTSGKSQEKWQ